MERPRRRRFGPTLLPARALFTFKTKNRSDTTPTTPPPRPREPSLLVSSLRRLNAPAAVTLGETKTPLLCLQGTEGWGGGRVAGSVRLSSCVTCPPPNPPTHTHTYFSWHLFSARQPMKGEPHDVNQQRRSAKDITIYSCFPPHESLPLPCLFLLPVNPSVFWRGRGVGEES